MKYTETLKQLVFFDLATLKVLVNLEGRSLYKLVKRRVNDNTFIQLKKGVYTTTKFVDNNKNLFYKEKIANTLKKPSYLSLEYMLSKYSILTESVYTFTSISTKKTNAYSNPIGTYSYRNIKKSLFRGYFLENDVYYATRAKALFDYLYFKQEPIDIDSLRFNLSEITQVDLNEFQRYCENNSKMQRLYTTLIEYKKNVS